MKKCYVKFNALARQDLLVLVKKKTCFGGSLSMFVATRCCGANKASGAQRNARYSRQPAPAPP